MHGSLNYLLRDIASTVYIFTFIAATYFGYLNENKSVKNYTYSAEGIFPFSSFLGNTSIIPNSSNPL